MCIPASSDRPTVFQCARAGFLTGAVFAALALAGMLLTGGQLAEKIPAPISYLLLGDLLAGLLGGLIVGAVLPHASGRWGAYFLGAVGSFPYFFMLALLFSAVDVRDAIIQGVILALLAGGPIGLIWYARRKNGNAQ